MAYLAILSSRNGFHVVRPFPPRLERGQADVTGAQVDQVDVPVPVLPVVMARPGIRLQRGLAHRLPAGEAGPGGASRERTTGPFAGINEETAKNIRKVCRGRLSAVGF